MAVINPPERKLAKRTSVHCCKLQNYSPAVSCSAKSRCDDENDLAYRLDFYIFSDAATSRSCTFSVTRSTKYVFINYRALFDIPYARHYNPRFVYFLPTF